MRHTGNVNTIESLPTKQPPATELVGFRTSPAGKNQICVAASLSGVSVSAFVRAAAAASARQVLRREFAQDEASPEMAGAR